ncbi:calcium-dependent phosphotriesterase [Phlebopus sp. FC_14]|nr:calcium-dependent phosphotriesterase [Phlebopus sp. FC_14]
MISSAIAVAAVALVAATYSKATSGSANFTVPPGAQYINPLSYNVVGANYTQWRNISTYGFNPTNATPPFIQIFDPSFLSVLGPSSTIRRIADHPGFAFAHEAPIYDADLNAVFFCSNAGGTLGYSGWYNNSVVSMINLTEVDSAIASATGDVDVPVQTLDLPDTVQMVNGGTGPYKGNLLFVTSGRGSFLPPSVVLVNPGPPYNTTVLLDNFFGRQFNSLNDVKLLPGTDIIFFTDPEYGWLNGFRPQSMLPPQVYRFDPSAGTVRVVADGFVEPNGIAISADRKTAFVTDSGSAGGFLGTNQTLPATIYQFDIEPTTQTFVNRRVFAYTDSGVPDGIQLDTMGNVYSGCGDGIHVWNPQGTLIGKFYMNSTIPQLIFTKSGLIILNEEAVFLANIQAQGINLTAP